MFYDFWRGSALFVPILGVNIIIHSMRAIDMFQQSVCNKAYMKGLEISLYYIKYDLFKNITMKNQV